RRTLQKARIPPPHTKRNSKMLYWRTKVLDPRKKARSALDSLPPNKEADHQSFQRDDDLRILLLRSLERFREKRLGFIMISRRSCALRLDYRLREVGQAVVVKGLEQYKKIDAMKDEITTLRSELLFCVLRTSVAFLCCGTETFSLLFNTGLRWIALAAAEDEMEYLRFSSFSSYNQF
uniref:Kinesin motor domain-containing protein n=1 Tax=Haemonchus contortus TaxID=6289 RepID=A0A7I4YXN5_HAECO